MPLLKAIGANKPKPVGESRSASALSNTSAMSRTSTRYDPADRSLELGLRAPTADEALLMNQKFTTTARALAELRFEKPTVRSPVDFPVVCWSVTPFAFSDRSLVITAPGPATGHPVKKEGSDTPRAVCAAGPLFRSQPHDLRTARHDEPRGYGPLTVSVRTDSRG